MKIVVVGLGKIGLPLAVQFASKGHTVVGADISERVVELVNAATPPFPGETDLDERLTSAAADGLLSASTDTAGAVSGAEVVVVVVPLVVDEGREPDFRALDAATDAVGEGLQPGTLVSYETTLPVSSTRQRFAPALAKRSGLALGTELFVCHSPERVFSGRIFADLARYPKLVGGIDAPSSERAVAFYEAVLDFDQRTDLSKPNGVWDLGSSEAAELAKLAETTYRDINIALANELAHFAESLDVDVYGVIDACNSQPYSHIHSPGIAVGGHCIPVYPRFYLSGDPAAKLPAAGREVNDEAPRRAVRRLQEVAGGIGGIGGKRVAVLGAAYRGGVKETAFSGVFPVVDELQRCGAIPAVHDPLYEDEELSSLGFEPFHLGQPCDFAVIQSDHDEYAELTPDDLPGIAILLDGRDITDAARWMGTTRLTVGRPTRTSDS